MKRLGIGLLCMLWGVSVYGQGNFVKKLLRRNVARSVPQAEPASRSISTAALSRQIGRAEQMTRNTVSYTMQKEVAQSMRPYLFNKDWEKYAHQTNLAPNMMDGIVTVGNLTEMSSRQLEQGRQIYRQAMDKVHALSKQVDAKIYYLATPEAEQLLPIEINRTLEEIRQAQNGVAQAQIIWGTDSSLQTAAAYLKKLHNFYVMLSTGSYPLEDQKPLMRADGHMYRVHEFGLWYSRFPRQIPSRTWQDPTTWFGVNARGVLPQKQRVAVLQDDQEVLAGLQEMKETAGLTEWQIDVYDDPEFFLNSVPYQQYDLILTDVLIKNGGGRYLARQLRSRGFEGSILTLSGFSEVHGGELFFNDGIDGMITIAGTDYAGRFWSTLNYYFVLKEKYGWKH